MAVVRQIMVVGLHRPSTISKKPSCFVLVNKDNKNKPTKYSSVADVVNDFKAGKLDVGDRIELL
jgi:hypothetical protein